MCNKFCQRTLTKDEKWGKKKKIKKIKRMNVNNIATNVTLAFSIKCKKNLFS